MGERGVLGAELARGGIELVDAGAARGARIAFGAADASCEARAEEGIQWQARGWKAKHA